MMLTPGAMPVAAGAKEDMALAAFFTTVDSGAIMFCFAVCDSGNDFKVLTRHGISKTLQILGAM